MQVVEVHAFGYRGEGAGHGRAIEGFGYLPGQTLLLLRALNVAGGEVYAQGYLVVVFAGKFFLYVLAVLADLEYQLALVMQVLREVGIVELLAGEQQCALGLHENDRGSGEVIL